MKNGHKKLREGEAGSCEEIERGLDDTAVGSNHSSVQWTLDNLNCSLGKTETEPTVAAVRLHFTATVSII